MKNRTEKDVENLIKNSAFPNPAHKEALRRRLFDAAVPLELEELDLVAGGKNLPEQEAWTAWPAPEDDKL